MANGAYRGVFGNIRAGLYEFGSVDNELAQRISGLSAASPLRRGRGADPGDGPEDQRVYTKEEFISLWEAGAGR
ncbi:hypothetical protein [Nocardia sp. NPDC050710]|uniref:hypothetical protein n=1 Tax=Nocardia sp. NPDC050710 TaxID=3157220 RepID=UPI0033E2D313